jgi:hypothetical protein
MTAPDQTNAEVSDERLREIAEQSPEGRILRPKDAERSEVLAIATELLTRRSVTSQASEGAVVARKKSMTLDLTDAEIEALEALAKKQELSPARVLIQGLRHYQLLVEGAPDLGPMLPPGSVIAPEWPIGDAYVTWYEPQETPKPGKLIDCSLAVLDDAEIGDRFYSEKQVHEIVALYASPSKRVERLETALKDMRNAIVSLPTDALGDDLLRTIDQALQGGRS